MPDDELSVGFRHLEIEVHFRLRGEEAIRTHCRKQVHYEIVEAPVTGMHQLGNVLEHVVDGLDDASFPKHDPVVKRHQVLLHIGAQAGHDMDSIVPQMSEKGLGDVSLVRVKFAEHLVCQGVNDGLIAVVDIGAGQDEVHKLPFLVAQQMQLEAHIPPHRALAFGGDVPEDLHVELPLVVYHGNAGAVHKAYAGAFSETGKTEEHRQGHEATRHDLHQTVVREPPGETDDSIDRIRTTDNNA